MFGWRALGDALSRERRQCHALGVLLLGDFDLLDGHEVAGVAS